MLTDCRRVELALFPVWLTEDRDTWAERSREAEARADTAERKVERLREVLQHVEDWWLKDGMKQSFGAPYAIFAVRAALKETGPEKANV